MNPKQDLRRTKIGMELADLRIRHGVRCWVCGKHLSNKTHGIRCRKCVSLGGTNLDVMRYEELKRQIGGLVWKRYKADKFTFDGLPGPMVFNQAKPGVRLQNIY